jgi:hypothetical protein
MRPQVQALVPPEQENQKKLMFSKLGLEQETTITQILI